MTNDDGQLRLRADDLSWAAASAEIVALDLRQSRYFVTNESGMHMWRLLSEGTTATLLEAALVNEYGIDQATASTGVAGFLDELRAKSLLADQA